MTITPIDMGTLRARIKEVKSLDTVKTLKAAKATTQSAKQLLGIISPLDLKLASSLAKRVKDLEIDTAKTKAPNWFVQQIDRIPWLKKLRLFAASSLDKTIEFFKNTAVAVDKILTKVPGWAFIKKLSGKSWEFLVKVAQHPLVGKFLSVLGLVANVFSIFSAISQWRELFKMSERLDKFQSKVLNDIGRDFTKIVNQVLPLKKQMEKLNRDIPVTNQKIKTLEQVIPEIKKNNQRLADEIRNQNATIKGMQKGLALAVTANVMNAAIGSVVSKYQLSKLSNNVAPYSSQLPQIAIQGKQIKELQSKATTLTPSQIQEIVKKVQSSPGAQGKPGINGINGKDGRNGLNGINGINGTNGVNGVNGKNGTDGRDGKDGLVSVIYQYLPGKPGKDGRNGVDATMDPDTKAKINAIFVETQGSKATQQSLLTSAVTTQTTVVNTQQQVGVIGNSVNALVNLNQAIDKKLSGFIKWSGLDRVYNILIVITNLMMIASLLRGTVDLVVTTIETGWSLFGFGLKDAEGNQLSLSTAISGSLRQGLEQIIGKENVNDLEVTWVKNNRIYQAASAIAWNVVSVVDQTRTLGEQTLGHLNKFANGAKDSGVVAEDAWLGHWNENPTGGPLSGVVNNLEQLSSKVAIAVMPIATAAGVKGELDQLEVNKTNFKTALETSDKQISDEIAASKPKIPTTLTNMQIGKVTP